jgi:hypothetical protein
MPTDPRTITVVDGEKMAIWAEGHRALVQPLITNIETQAISLHPLIIENLRHYNLDGATGSFARFSYGSSAKQAADHVYTALKQAADHAHAYVNFILAADLMFQREVDEPIKAVKRALNNPTGNITM